MAKHTDMAGCCEQGGQFVQYRVRDPALDAVTGQVRGPERNGWCVALRTLLHASPTFWQRIRVCPFCGTRTKHIVPLAEGVTHV